MADSQKRSTAYIMPMVTRCCFMLMAWSQVSLSSAYVQNMLT